MIDTCINWLKQNRLINLLLVVGYVLFIVFAHEWFVNLSVDMMNRMSIETYDKVIAIIAASGLALVLALVVFSIRSKIKIQLSGLVFVGLVLTGLLVHFFVFTEMNVEFIHALEFGLLALLIYPLVGRFGAAAIYALPVMLFDEWYQYQVLFDYVEYFDFNDILLDLLGAGLFLSIIKTFSYGLNKPTSLFQRNELYFLVLIIISVVVMLWSAIVVPYAADSVESTLLVLNDIQEPYGFWREHPLIGSTYHVFEPIAGLITIFSVCLAYLAMDSIKSEK